MKKLISALILLSLPALAAGDNIVPKLARHWRTSRAYTLAIANQMPEAEFNYKPNADQMSFREQLIHIAGMNDYFFSKITGSRAAAPKLAKLDKASVVAAVAESFDRALKVVESLTPERAGNNMEVLLMAADHTTHHRGQCVVYLRARGIKPAEYQF